MPRDDRQYAVKQWAVDAFGEASMAIHERIARLLEEVIELAQAEEFPPEQIARLVEHVYSKPPGIREQEVGGIGVTLLAYCAVIGISADEAEEREVLRVLGKPLEHFRTRQNAKAAAGIALEVPLLNELEHPSELRAVEIHRRIALVKEEMDFWRGIWGTGSAVYRERLHRLFQLEEELNRRLQKMPLPSLCSWPGCQALCSSGNYGGALACGQHFLITNGTATC